ncbi:MAG: UDP-N-acetylglucosamine--N-acetylmuramyl-(pentapeptide) pyrophosphoryl-undecaprenol N-acetylglucosamine transferase [Minisyncoccia bacterium]
MEELLICLTGGATGGHFFPLLSVAKLLKEECKRRNLNLRLIYIGAKPFKKELLEKEGVEVYEIPAGKVRRYFDIKNFLDFLKFPLGLLKAFWLVYKFMPNVVFSKGGYGSLEVVLSAWFFRIPILIHESDSIPGRSNIIAGKFATRIAVSFTKSKKYFDPKKTALVGQPIDPDFDKIIPEDFDYRRFGLEKDKKTILVIGGSQGSMKINEVVIESLDELLHIGQVVHQLGERLYKEFKDIAYGFILENVPARKKDYHPIGFIEHNDLIKLMKISDLIISRAGAGAIFEISACGKPSILIPIREEVSGKHQIENAYEYADIGAAIVIEEPNLSKGILTSIIKRLFNEPETLETMKKSALEFSKKEATKYIVQELLILTIGE